MSLQPDSVDFPGSKVLMNKRWDFRPVTHCFVFDERAVNVEARVAFDADITSIWLVIDDDGLHDPAVLQDRIAQLLRGGGSLSFVRAATAGYVERERNLLVGRLTDVDFEEAPDARVRPVSSTWSTASIMSFPELTARLPVVSARPRNVPYPRIHVNVVPREPPRLGHSHLIPCRAAGAR